MNAYYLLLSHLQPVGSNLAAGAVYIFCGTVRKSQPANRPNQTQAPDPQNPRFQTPHRRQNLCGRPGRAIARDSSGFTILEVTGVVMILLILAGMAVVFFGQHRDEAIALRRTNAAAALNAAERALDTYNDTTAPGLGEPAATVTALDVAGRIAQLQSHGFLVSIVRSNDVQLVLENGTVRWTPAGP